MMMAFEPGTFDFVFTNWLFMYLNDQELALLAPRLLRCLSPGGRLFFRESCNRQSGDRSRAFNPSHYRSASDYTQLFESTTLPCGARFTLQASGCVQSRSTHTPAAVAWMMRVLLRVRV
jgi:phosphoethanolamine N-methyltransferase